MLFKQINWQLRIIIQYTTYPKYLIKSYIQNIFCNISKIFLIDSWISKYLIKSYIQNIFLKSYIQNIFCNISKNLFVPKISKYIFLPGQEQEQEEQELSLPVLLLWLTLLQKRGEAAGGRGNRTRNHGISSSLWKYIRNKIFYNAINLLSLNNLINESNIQN
jgi:hypothetical protein